MGKNAEIQKNIKKCEKRKGMEKFKNTQKRDLQIFVVQKKASSAGANSRAFLGERDLYPHQSIQNSRSRGLKSLPSPSPIGFAGVYGKVNPKVLRRS